MGFDAKMEGYDLVEVDGRVCLFSYMRLDRNSVPEGIFCYEVEDSEREDCSFGKIKERVEHRRMGSILCRGKLNSFISWVGGKKALRKTIYGMMPAKYDRYIEVFGGGGWVLFGKEPDKGVMEVFNDYNADLINLYRCVKNRTWELLQVLGFLPLNSRDEFMEIKSFLEMGECGRKQVAEELELAFHNLPPAEFEEMQGLLQGKAVAEDVRRAAAFYKIIRYSYGSGCTSYSCQPFDVRKVFSLIREAAERLADTVIENKDFEALIRQYDREGAFFYCDPPYYMTEDYYEVSFPEQDHIRLKNTLAGCQGKWMVSYNDCSYIRDLYAGYYLTEATRLNNMAQRYEKGSEYRELIITNYDPEEKRRSSGQMTLFAPEFLGGGG